jgi:predicted N-acetyltransferase YhbS
MSVEPLPSRPALTLVHETPADGPAVEALLDRAFGPGRFVKVSERVREVAAFAPDLSFLARAGDELTGVVRQWRVRVGETPAVFLGPLAVEPGRWSGGVGGALVQRACDAAQAAGEAAVLLVGDPPFFSRFGFQVALASRVRLPGPVDLRRVQVRAFRAEGEALEGPVQGLKAG